MAEKKIGQVDDKQVAEWKKKHGDIFKIEIENHVAYLKKPSRHILAAASKALEDSSVQYAEDIFNNCYIGGSREIIDNDDFFLGAMQVIDQLVEVKSASLEKL